MVCLELLLDLVFGEIADILGAEVLEVCSFGLTVQMILLFLEGYMGHCWLKPIRRLLQLKGSVSEFKSVAKLFSEHLSLLFNLEGMQIEFVFLLDAVGFFFFLLCNLKLNLSGLNRNIHIGFKPLVIWRQHGHLSETINV